MNPNPTQSNWCAANSYPYYCSSFAEGERYQVRVYSAIFISGISVIALILLLSCMALIVMKVRRQEKDAATDNDNDHDQSRQSSSAAAVAATSIGTGVRTIVQEQLLYEKKTISRQAWAYTVINLFNYLMIVILPVVRNLMDNPIPPTWWQVMVLVLRPLQGLFNCIIFIYHKVNGLQRNDPCLQLWPALKMVLKGEEGQTRIVSDLILVRHHSALAQVNFADGRILLEDVEEEDADDNENDDENEVQEDPDENDNSNDDDMAQLNRENRITISVTSGSNEQVIGNNDNDHHPSGGGGLSPVSATAIANINTTVFDEEEALVSAEHGELMISISEDRQGACQSQDLSGFQPSP